MRRGLARPVPGGKPGAGCKPDAGCQPDAARRAATVSRVVGRRRISTGWRRLPVPRHDARAERSQRGAMGRSRLLVAALVFGFMAGTGHEAGAQPYPTRPIKLIAPFPAGGPVDVMARLIAQQLSATVGQVIVENRPGAGATIGAKSVAIADPDGYTLLLGSSASLAIGPALFRSAGYDPVKSFVPIALVSNVPYVMVAATTAPFRTVPELLAHAARNPGKLNFGVPNGAPPHILAIMFRQLTGA